MNVLEDKIMTKKRFSAGIETLVRDTGMSYIDAATFIIEDRGMEYRNLGKLLSDSLKDKIEVEASNLNLIKTIRGNTLPL